MFPEVVFDAIRRGRAVLVTGAGASRNGTNRLGKPIASTEQISEIVAEEAGFTYGGEDIKDVFDAALVPLGSSALSRIFADQYVNTRPSPALKKLFGVTWHRVYTFNVDDTIENTPRHSRVQNLRVFNALKDRREEWRGYQDCQVVHLHGIASDIGAGLIFSNDDYATSAVRQSGWYTQLGEDFVDHTVVFVGTSLKESLLFQNIKAALSSGANAGHSYSITPSSLSQIQVKSLETRGIIHIAATLEDFSAALDQHFPTGLRPRELASDSAAAKVASVEKYTAVDVEALRAIHPITRADLERRFPSQGPQLSSQRRRFFEGYGPSWPVVRAEAYAQLAQYSTLDRLIDDGFGKSRAVVVLGESGSGKSTYVMRYAWRAADAKKIPVFDYSEGTTSFRQTMVSLRKYLGDQRALVVLDSLHVFYDDLVEVVSDPDLSGIVFLSSARTAEWNDKLASILRGYSTTVTMQRFSNADIPALIDTIAKNFAAPNFNKLTTDEKTSRFQRSRKQLLIALREVTESKGFDEIIGDEYSRITDRGQRLTLIIAAIATISRVGISRSMLGSVFGALATKSDLSSTIKGLEGIIDASESGRYQARHQVYASEIVYKNADFDDVMLAQTEMVNYFVKFKPPIIKSVSKSEGQLFKYLLNNWNIFQLYRNAERKTSAVDFFRQFEVSLQLDGHYWLQYALLLRRLGRHEDALVMLERSIAAYPQNAYAHHARAQQQLIIAAQQRAFTPLTQNLIQEAVSYLLARHNSGFLNQGGSSDEYPIVVLGYYHIDALMRHGQDSSARRSAKLYFSEISKSDVGDPIVGELRSKLLMLSTTGEWKQMSYKFGEIDY